MARVGPKRWSEVDGRVIELSNTDKVLFPTPGLTKGDLITYYRRIAPVMLPHLAGRPLSLQRYPDGVEAEGFMQKNASDYFPHWIRRARLAKENGEVEHVLADDAATLVYLANQACITLHVGLARVDRIDHPDRLVIDLDPSDQDFDKVKRAARAARRLLEALGLVPFVQLTGRAVCTSGCRSTARRPSTRCAGSLQAWPSAWLRALPTSSRPSSARRSAGRAYSWMWAATLMARPRSHPIRCGPGPGRRWPRPWTGASSTTLVSSPGATRSPICFAASAGSLIPGATSNIMLVASAPPVSAWRHWPVERPQPLSFGLSE